MPQKSKLLLKLYFILSYTNPGAITWPFTNHIVYNDSLLVQFVTRDLSSIRTVDMMNITVQQHAGQKLCFLRVLLQYSGYGYTV